MEVPALTVLAVEGSGDPGASPEYQDAIGSLMTLAWGIRAALKARLPPITIKVMPLEGEWTLPGIAFREDPAVRKKPERRAIERIDLPVLPAVTATHLLHVGPFREEPASIRRLHTFIAEHGGRPRKGHREIYLSDPGRTAPDKLRTILRVRFIRE